MIAAHMTNVHEPTPCGNGQETPSRDDTELDASSAEAQLSEKGGLGAAKVAEHADAEDDGVELEVDGEA
jgi:hypothetical protein